MIDAAVRAGVGVVAMTAGNSMYATLTYDEIKSLTRMMVEGTAGRALTIAATGPWWTGQSEDYARFAESLGADAVQVLMAPRADEDSHVAHYRAVAAATRLGIVVHGAPSLALAKRLAGIDSVVAMKAEFPVETTVGLYEELGDRLNIFQGGQKSHFLAYQPYGMKAYFSAFSTFAPDVAKWLCQNSTIFSCAGCGEKTIRYSNHCCTCATSRRLNSPSICSSMPP